MTREEDLYELEAKERQRVRAIRAAKRTKRGVRE